jgi:hypothetical protein
MGVWGRITPKNVSGSSILPTPGRKEPLKKMPSAIIERSPVYAGR